MASTSTNKQPLLIDRVFNESIYTDKLYSGSTTSIDIAGINAAQVLVNCTTNDGGIVEDMFTVSRDTSSHLVMFYLSSAVDFLRTDQAVYVGEVATGTTVGTFTNVTKLPSVLAPVPHLGVVAPLATATSEFPAGTPLRNMAFYVPSGKALWCTVQGTAALNEKAPIAGAQGGFF